MTEKILDRRSLIKTSLAAALSLSMPVFDAGAAQQEVSSEKRMRAAVPGFLLNDESLYFLMSGLKQIFGITYETFECIQGRTLSPLMMLDKGHADIAFTNLDIESHLPDCFHFFSGIPFGLNTIEFISWIKQDNGQQMLDEAFSKRGLKTFIFKINGSSGGAWHRKEISSVKDYAGRKIIAHGFSARIFEKFGASVIDLYKHKREDSGEHPKAMFEAGHIDAVEGINPSEIIDMGFERTEGIYYWPGWQNPMESFFMVMKKKYYDSLSQSIKNGIDRLCYSSLSFSTAAFTYRNSMNTSMLTSIPGMRIRRIPDKVIRDLAGAVLEALENTGALCPETRTVHDSYMKFFKKIIGWTQTGDEAFSLARSLTFTYSGNQEKNR